MSTRVPVKSILKTQPKPAQQAVISPDQDKADRDRHNYNLALAHAHRIQEQKDWDARILKVIEVLLEYPAATVPTAQEAETLAKLLQPFQPSDLDALVEERVVDGKCGYALCAKRPRSLTLGREALWRAGEQGKDFCSAACERKTAGVKAQLSELPASEREGVHPRIVLDEPALMPTMGSQPVGVKRVAVANGQEAEELAQERGEGAASWKPKQVMSDRIVEKAATTFKPLSGLHDAGVSHTAIEGYEPTGRIKDKKRGHGFDGDSEEEEDELDAEEHDDEDDG